MYLAIITIVLCLVFWLLCYLGTGSDEKNIKSYSTYSKDVQDIVKTRENLAPLIRESNVIVSFVSNVLIFTILLFIGGVFIRQDTFVANFVMILIMGESLNAFDFLVMDLCWWRHTKRVRFTGTEDRPELYRGIKKHFYPFLRGIVCFLIVALIVGGILTLF